MIRLQIRDDALPALAELTASSLSRIVGAKHVDILRFRYRRGRRAVLHVTCRGEGSGTAREGAIWFFAGDKAARIAARNIGSTYDPATGALFDAFPHDHRLPEIHRFWDAHRSLAPVLIGGEQASHPTLMRYRPGISATFRWQRIDGRVCYVKIIAKENIRALAGLNIALADAARGSGIGVAGVCGAVPELRAIAYEQAAGIGLDRRLATASCGDAGKLLMRVVLALGRLGGARVHPSRTLDRSTLLARAEKAARTIDVVDGPAGDAASRVLDRMRTDCPHVRTVPIHGDIKLEHVFATPERITVVDTESLSLGDPDYDLAKLEIRLTAGVIDGLLGETVLDAGRKAIRGHVGRCYPWFFDAARLQMAQHYAQRPTSDAAANILALLRA